MVLILFLTKIWTPGSLKWICHQRAASGQAGWLKCLTIVAQICFGIFSRVFLLHFLQTRGCLKWRRLENRLPLRHTKRQSILTPKLSMKSTKSRSDGSACQSQSKKSKNSANSKQWHHKKVFSLSYAARKLISGSSARWIVIIAVRPVRQKFSVCIAVTAADKSSFKCYAIKKLS